MKKILVIFSLLLITATFFGIDDKLKKECFGEANPKKERVYDKTGNTLSKSEIAKLNQKLGAFSDSTSNQIIIVITNDLCDLAPQIYATEIGHYWGVGQAKFDNGIVILVAPEDRETFIATGYGLEGAIPDITAWHIVEKELIPHFKNKQWFTGLNQATDIIMHLAVGDYNAQEYGQAEPFPKSVLFFFAIFFGLIILSFVVAARKARNYALLNSIGFWEAYTILSALRRKQSGNSRGGGYLGGGGGGFSGGGGFGGFGGGGFGGGGAGGGW